MNEFVEAAGLAGVSSLIAHGLYHRHEPTVKGYVTELILLVSGFVLYSTYRTHQHSIFLLTALFTALHLLILGTSIAIYRVSFHPLRKYPGPFLAKITKWHGFYICATGRTHLIHPEMFRRYGDVVRIGPNELMFGDPNAVKAIHGAYAMKIPKGPNYDVRLWSSGVSLGDTRDIKAHKVRRKIWDRGLNTKALAAYESRILAITEQFCVELEKQIGKQINASDWMDFFAFDTMGDLAFNETFGFIKAGKINSLRDFVRKGLYLTHLFRNVEWLSHLYSALPKDKDTKEKLESFVNVSYSMYTKRRAMGTKPSDLFSYLLREDPDSGFALSEQDLAADAPVIIIAGSDTTSVALTYALYYMTRNPRILKALIEEIDNAWDKFGNPLVGNKLSDADMPYLNAVLNESMRIVPPSPDGNQRTIPPGGHDVNGDFIPAGTQVHSNPSFMHRDPRNFTNPQSFIPERWIDSKRDPSWVHNVHAYIPFSSGQYVCPGKALALLEMRLFLTRVLRDYVFEMSPDFDHEGYWLGLVSYMGYVKTALMLTPRRRVRDGEMNGDANGTVAVNGAT